MELNRKPTTQEVKLLELLVPNAATPVPKDWKENILVCPMNDGGMGSLYLFPNGIINMNRKVGKRISEFQFTDQDGVVVIASLNVDDLGELLELDIWKTDFSRLLKLPDLG
jgi:hypothetical protein